MGIYVKRFAEAEEYEQEGGPSISYYTLLPKGPVKNLSMGLVKLKGPTWTIPNAHTEWEQCYAILSGKGTMHIGGRSYPIEGRMIVHIPYNTEHYVTLGEGEELEYLYVNSYI